MDYKIIHMGNTYMVFTIEDEIYVIKQSDYSCPSCGIYDCEVAHRKMTFSELESLKYIPDNIWTYGV